MRRFLLGLLCSFEANLYTYLRPKINIAIDGYSSCGKSTLAKQLASSLDYIFIDSGAMYRAVALYFLNNDIHLDNSSQVQEALSQINIDIQYPNQVFQILLDGEDITQRIIKLDVSSIVSEVAAISQVRRKLVEIQKNLGRNKGVIMDGRDIATVVFPDAELKIFVTANIDVRTARRHKELQEKNMPTDILEVRKNLEHRDHIDSTRADSPLRQTEDAILIDTSYMTRAEQLFLCQKLVEETIVLA